MYAIPITKDYDIEILQSPLPVVAEFYAKWCPKCDMMSGIYERLAKRYHQRIAFRKVDIDQYDRISAELGVEIIPTFIVYQNGEILGYTTGVLSEAVLEKRILEMLKFV